MECKLVLIMTLFLITAVIISGNISASFTITGKRIGNASVTGDVTQQASLKIVLDANPPNITLVEPKNKTYNYKKISLNFSIVDDLSPVNKVWYTVNNGTTNTTITENTTINLNDKASYTIILYANDSLGQLNSTRVTFFINESYGWTITSDKYSFNDDSYNNDSSQNYTAWYENMGKEYMQNISGFTLEIPNYGKIVFNTPLNISRWLDDLDDNSNINNNTILINSTNLPEFNMSATLYLYSLNFTNPRMLRDSVVCPSTICTQQSYSGGSLIVNVTGFSEYQADETPSEGGGSDDSGTGGVSESGGVTTVITLDEISVDKQMINIKLKQGETTTIKKIITNKLDRNLIVEIKTSSLSDFVIISNEKIKLTPKESKEVIFEITIKPDTTPNLYQGELIITTEKTQEKIPITIEVESTKSLFDIDVTIPTQSLRVLPGQELIANINLFNIGAPKGVDVLINYDIRSYEGKSIYQSSESVGIETRTSLSKNFQIPEDADFGDYILYIKVTYDGEVASASTWFSIGKKPLENITIVLYLIIAILMVMILIVLYEIQKIKKYLKHHYKVNDSMLSGEITIKK